MGNDLYLTRLLLGRSAFQAVDENSDLTPPAIEMSQSGNNTDDEYIQQYNAKGRPINSATERFNATQRWAMNEVLALVGVVEKKTEADARASWQATVAVQDRRSLLEAEHERGENIGLLVASLRGLNFCWPNADATLAKLLTGIYKGGTPFSTILGMEWQRFRGHGIKGALVAMNAGALADWTGFYAQMLFIAGYEEFFLTPMEYYILKQHWRRRTIRRLLNAVNWLGEALALASDIILLPLNYFTLLQFLNLASPTRLFPPLSLFNPFSRNSFHNFGWRSPFPSHPCLGTLFSPAVLLILSSLTTRSQDTHGPRLSLLTTFRYEPPKVWTLTNSSSEKCKPRSRDPLGHLYSALLSLRQKLQAWILPSTTITRHTDGMVDSETGYYDPLATDTSHTRVSLSLGEQVYITRHHRSTKLARLIPDYFSDSVDILLERICLLPLETVLLRSVASIAVSVGHANGASSGNDVAGGVYPPFDGFLAKVLFGTGAGGGRSERMKGLVGYAGKIALALILHAAMEVGWFGVAYGLVRWQGLRNFGWGAIQRKTRAGNAQSAKEEEEDQGREVELQAVQPTMAEIAAGMLGQGG